MLDQNLIDQLKTVFGKLEKPVSLVYSDTAHADNAQLLEMLNSVVGTSPLLSLKKSPLVSENPQFHLEYDGRPNGVSFQGIPSGHEFTSLIVAILNSDGKGKLPDEQIKARIRKLKGPIRLRTYISLTCENCPDVVQALNQMAILHGNFEHEMIDGAYAQAELARMGIQGVPSVIANSKLVYSGKLNLIDLMLKLEETFGTEEMDSSQSINPELGDFDVVVIGGGPAGSSAAIYTARKGLKVAMVAEKTGGQVGDTKGIENLISVSYTEGPQLVAQLNSHMGDYPIKLLEHRRVLSIEASQSSEALALKTIHLAGGESLRAKAIIITTGAKWRELNVPGEKDYIGRGVAYCPHCDGPYYKGKKIAVVGGGNSGVEAAIDLANLVEELTVFEYNDQLKADQVLVNKLNSLANVKVIRNAKTEAVLGDGQKVSGIQYTDRVSGESRSLTLDGIFVQIGLLPNSQFVKGLVETTPHGEIVVDLKGRTSIKGIYAAGDVTTVPYKQIIIAMGEGAKVALAAFEDQMLA